MAEQPTVPLNLHCHCRQLKVTAHIPTSLLPLPITLCHCNTCSAVTGQLCATVVGCSTHAPGRPLQINGKATGYRTSSALERFFCPECGASVYEDAGEMEEGMMFLDTGAFEGNEVEVGGVEVKVAEVGEHIFVKDTEDGGLRDWMPNVKAWEGWMDGRSREVPRGEYFGKGMLDVDGDGARKKGEMLRLISGYDINAWAVIPRGNFVTGEGENVHFEQLSKMGTFKEYSSSKGTVRGFCSTCGATVSCKSGNEPDTVDMAVGLMRVGSRTGSRVEEWLQWEGHLPFKDIAQKKDMAEMLDEGLKRWSKAH